jgi:hypothetical protein
MSITSRPKDKGMQRTSKFWLAGTGQPEVYSPSFFYTAATDAIVKGVTAKPELDDLVMRNLTS